MATSSNSPGSSSAGSARRLPTGSRSRAWALDDGDGRRVVVKLTAPASAAREAAALAHVAGLGIAPELIAHGDGVIVTALVDGDMLAAASITPAHARALGEALARLHACERHAVAGYDGWRTPARSLDEYRARRAASIRAAAGGRTGDALSRTASAPPHETPSETPFVLVHGDVWAGNVIWQDARPTLVDWEFRRTGDPAEELAYAIAMDDLPDAPARALLHGHGRPELAAAVSWWRPLLAAECAAWYAAGGDARRAAALDAQALRLSGG